VNYVNSQNLQFKNADLLLIISLIKLSLLTVLIPRILRAIAACCSKSDFVRIFVFYESLLTMV